MLKVGISLNNEILYSKLKIDTFKTGFPLTHCTAYSHKFSFLIITQKLKLLELRIIVSANINSTIVNILSPKPSLYELQRLRYDFATIAIYAKTVFRDLRENGRSWSLELL